MAGAQGAWRGAWKEVRVLPAGGTVGLGGVEKRMCSPVFLTLGSSGVPPSPLRA